MPQIRNVAEAEYVPITVDTVSVVTMVLGVWANIRGYRDEIVKELPGFDIALFDGLEGTAMALGHAQTEYQTANEPPPSLVELGAKVLKIRGILLNDLGTQVARELLPESVLKEVKGGTGYKSYAFDVFAMSNVYRRNWDKVSGFASIKSGELDEAEALADALTTAVGEREQAPVTQAQITRDRQAAFTLLLDVYDEVRIAVAYIRRKAGDIDTLMASLYLNRVAVTPTVAAPATTPNEQPAAAKPAVATTGPYT